MPYSTIAIVIFLAIVIFWFLADDIWRRRQQRKRVAQQFADADALASRPAPHMTVDEQLAEHRRRDYADSRTARRAAEATHRRTLGAHPVLGAPYTPPSDDDERRRREQYARDIDNSAFAAGMLYSSSPFSPVHQGVQHTDSDTGRHGTEASHQSSHDSSSSYDSGSSSSYDSGSSGSDGGGSGGGD